MGIVKRDAAAKEDYTAFQLAVISVLDEYDYVIVDLRYIEELKQIVITLNWNAEFKKEQKGIVLFISPNEISLSFEISTTPDVIANLVLILSERIIPSKIHITDSFIITKDIKNKMVAVFGEDAQEIYEKDLANGSYNNQYVKILTDPSVVFYDC
jgi:hypothetical protein